MNTKLNAVKLGLAGGIMWGLIMLITTWLSMYTGYGMFWLSQWMDLYPWFDLSLLGSIVGLIWGFIDGFVGLFVLAWLYNRLVG